MKCIDEALIQRYMDGETGAQETGRIEKHVAGCSQCARNIEEQRAFADCIKREIGHWGKQQPDFIPEFIAPVVRKHRLNVKIRHYIYTVSAACAIFLFVILFPDRNEKKGIQLIFSVDGDFDSNRTASQQEMIILMIDANGNIAEY